MKRAILFVLLTLSTVPLSFASHAQTAQELGNHTYDASGNVKSIGPDDEGLTNLFDYDSAGRLIRFIRKNESSGATVITETYEYDAYGNLVKQTTNGVPANYPAAATTNRLTSATYDAVGNMTARGSESYTYDPIGTLTQRSGNWGNAFYIYTADDERVAVGGPDGTFRYMARDLDGKVLREWSSQTWSGAWSWVEDYVYRGGSLVAASRPSSQGGDRHFHLDHLGTPRLITNSSATIYAEHAYYPFGREISSPTQEMDNFGHDTPEPMKFTGHERDFAGSYTGTSLDYMHARYNDTQAGRFLSLDQNVDVQKNLAEPLRWNRYSYVTNNPLAYDDPDGRERRILLAGTNSAGEMQLNMILDRTVTSSQGWSHDTYDSGYTIDVRHSLAGKTLLSVLGEIDNSGTDILIINSHGGKPLQTDTGGGKNGAARFNFGASEIASNLGGRPQAIVLAGCGTMDSAQSVANATGSVVFGIKSGAETYAGQISRAGAVLANVYAATGSANFAIAVANKLLKRVCPKNGGTCSQGPEFQVVRPKK